MKLLGKTRIAFLTSLFFFIVSISLYYLLFSPRIIVQDESLQKYSIEELAKYNGADKNLPIYIGLNGYVYDVTPGREYYEEGGSYHYLAGKDSSKELNLIGGDIIKRKYKIVGRLDF